MLSLNARLERLEASRPHGRIVPIWTYCRDQKDIAAEVAELKRTGRVTDQDHLHLITWMDTLE